MSTQQARVRLEAATQSTGHLLARYGETPHTVTSGEWLGLMAVQARELVRAVSDYLDSERAAGPCPPRPDPTQAGETATRVTGTHAAGIAGLDSLAAELTARGFTVRTAHGPLPCLDVQNPRASVLAERIFARGGSFWWSWGEPLTACDQAAEAAAILARVLRTVGEEVETAP